MEEKEKTNWKKIDKKTQDNRSAVDILRELVNDPEAIREAKMLTAECSC